MKKRILSLSLALLILLSAFMVVDFLGIQGKSVTVIIPKGAGAGEISALLKENHVVCFSFLFRRYISHDASFLKEGVHSFRKGMGYRDALEELKKDVPLENTITVTIPEGFEAREIGELLESLNIITKNDFDAACQKAHADFDFLPKDGNVEGYLFPATYNFQIGADAKEIVCMMIQSFVDKMYTPQYKARCEELGISFSDALTLASVIEREAAKDSERAIVSSVFHNRLKKGMRLESCATVQYILKERKDVLSISDTKIDSPYNTYMYEGLPPSPIASPGEKSLYAALYPENTSYLFFVADGTGGHTFSETYEGHLNAVNAN